MSRRKLVFLTLIGSIALIGGISVAQETIVNSEAEEAEEEKALEESFRELAPRVTSRSIQPTLAELEVVGRVHLKLPKDTRWQVERPLDENLLYVTLSPRPEGIEEQLKSYRSLQDFTVSVERSSDALVAIRIEQKRRDSGPLLLYAGTEEPTDFNKMSRVSTPNGVIEGEEGGDVYVHFGRATRLSPAQTLCRLLRRPYPPFMPDTYTYHTDFKRAEKLFARGEYEEALEAYGEIASPLSPTPELHRYRKGGQREILIAPLPDEEVEQAPLRGAYVEPVMSLASLRQADIMVCLDRPRAAKLRYDLLQRGGLSPFVRVLAGLQMLQVDEVPAGEIQRVFKKTKEQFEEIKKRPALESVIRLHAMRVALQDHNPDLALEIYEGFSEEQALKLDDDELTRLTERAIGEAASRRIKSQDDIGLVSLVTRYENQVGYHPRHITITTATATALRRLMLPKRAVGFLQQEMKRSNEAGEDLVLLATLARGYRDSGDSYRANRTLNYLLERLRQGGNWLGRREEVAISMAAAEISLDKKDWMEARAWLARADKAGAGEHVDALLAYAHGRELLLAGDRKGATGALLHAAKKRRLISSRRRAEVCLLAAQLLEEFGQIGASERLLRRLMEETPYVDREIEVAWKLAQLLERHEQLEKAHALYAEISQRRPEGSYGKLAKYRAEEVTFHRKHAGALSILQVSAD